MCTLVIEAFGAILAGVKAAEGILLPEAKRLRALGHDVLDLAAVELILPK